MKLVSLFNPVNLSNDPEFGNDGDLYFNTASNSYRLYISSSWINIATTLDTSPVKTINNVGSSEIGEVSLTLNESFINSTIIISSASFSRIIVPDDDEFDCPIGSQIEIIRGPGEGFVDIVEGDGMSVRTPSTIYLTTTWDHISLLKIEKNVWTIQSEFRDLY